MTAGGAAAAAGAAAARARAIKASGAIVKVEPEDFLRLIGQQRDPLVVQANGGVFRAKFLYLSSYKGLTFFTSAPAPLELPAGSELVQAGKIWIP